MVMPDWTSMEGARVDHTAMSISGQELGESGVEVIRDEGGNHILIAVRNDKKVTRTNGVEVVLPSWTGEYSWLRARGARGAFLCVSIHRFSFQRFGFSLLV